MSSIGVDSKPREFAKFLAQNRGYLVPVRPRNMDASPEVIDLGMA
jgi:hypothetical protein